MSLGGWQITGSGIFPEGHCRFNVNNSAAWPNGDYNGDNNSLDRPNAPADSVARGGWGPIKLSQRAVRGQRIPRAPTPGTNGKSRPQTCSAAPGFAQNRFSHSLSRSPSPSEWRAQFRFDAFNALNRVKPE